MDVGVIHSKRHSEWHSGDWLSEEIDSVGCKGKGESKGKGKGGFNCGSTSHFARESFYPKGRRTGEKGQAKSLPRISLQVRRVGTSSTRVRGTEWEKKRERKRGSMEC